MDNVISGNFYESEKETIKNLEAMTKKLEARLEENRKSFQFAVNNLRDEGFNDEKIAEILVSTVEEVEEVKDLFDMSIEESLSEEVEKLRKEGKTEEYISDFSEGFRVGFKKENRKVTKNLLLYGIDFHEILYCTEAPRDLVDELSREVDDELDAFELYHKHSNEEMD